MAPKLAAAMILLLAIAMSQGCTTPAGGGGQSGGTQAPGSTGEIYPGPTVTVPPKYEVSIQENRNPNPVHPDITVTFRGGEGQIFLQKIVATVVPSVGMPVSGEIDRPTTPNGQIPVGDSVTLPGTTGVDRVIVVVTILGTDYKVMDMNDNFKAHP